MAGRGRIGPHVRPPCSGQRRKHTVRNGDWCKGIAGHSGGGRRPPGRTRAQRGGRDRRLRRQRIGRRPRSSAGNQRTTFPTPLPKGCWHHAEAVFTGPTISGVRSQHDHGRARGLGSSRGAQRLRRPGPSHPRVRATVWAPTDGAGRLHPQYRSRRRGPLGRFRPCPQTVASFLALTGVNFWPGDQLVTWPATALAATE